MLGFANCLFPKSREAAAEGAGPERAHNWSQCIKDHKGKIIAAIILAIGLALAGAYAPEWFQANAKGLILGASFLTLGGILGIIYHKAYRVSDKPTQKNYRYALLFLAIAALTITTVALTSNLNVFENSNKWIAEASKNWHGWLGFVVMLAIFSECYRQSQRLPKKDPVPNIFDHGAPPLSASLTLPPHPAGANMTGSIATLPPMQPPALDDTSVGAGAGRPNAPDPACDTTSIVIGSNGEVIFPGVLPVGSGLSPLAPMVMPEASPITLPNGQPLVLPPGLYAPQPYGVPPVIMDMPNGQAMSLPQGPVPPQPLAVPDASPAPGAAAQSIMVPVQS